MHPVATLPTITEAKVQEQNSSNSSSESSSQIEMKKPNSRGRTRNSESDATDADSNMPRNASQPAFTSHSQGNFLFFYTEESNKIIIIYFVTHRNSKEWFSAYIRSC